MASKFDNTEAYETTIAPIVAELEKACYRAKVPMFASFAVQGDRKGTCYRNSYLSPCSVRKTLANDQMAQHIRVVQGYKVIAPEDETEVSCE
jgi:hypothetical protein